MELAQMNVRLDAEVKKRGDCALREAGFAPAQWVHLVWDFLARNERKPEAVREVALQLSGEKSSRDEERERLRKLAADAPHYLENRLSALGITLSSSVYQGSYEELREAAMDDYLAERGLL